MDLILRLRRAFAGPHPLVLRVLMDLTVLLTIISLGALVQSWAADTPALVTTTDLNWNTILLAVISLIGTIFSGVVAVFMAKISASAKKTEESTDKIHTSVNSERTAALETIRGLRDDILRLTTKAAVQAEATRGAELAKAGDDARALAAAEQRQPALPPPTGGTP